MRCLDENLERVSYLSDRKAQKEKRSVEAETIHEDNKKLGEQREQQGVT